MLEAVHLRPQAVEAGGRVGNAYRQLGEHRRDSIVVDAALAGAAYRHRNKSADRAVVDPLAPCLEQVAQATGDDRQDDVVDGPAERGTHRLHVAQPHVGPRPGAVGADRADQRGPSERA